MSLKEGREMLLERSRKVFADQIGKIPAGTWVVLG